MEYKANRPRWIQVRDELERRIRSGQYAPGAQIPTVLEMQTEFSIANMTVHKVLARLRQDGLITSVQGLGSFAAEELPPAE